jgi:hypothetical protein
MRKTFVVALVALMVMFAVTSCDNIPIPGGEKPEYDADGRELVTVSVSVNGTVGNSRSLKDEYANPHNSSGSGGITDFYEVIFRRGVAPGTSPFTYYRDSNTYAISGSKIKVGIGSYGANDAIVLLGRKWSASDCTLLATGVITKVIYKDTTEDDTAPFDVNKDTDAIIFTVKSLEADISPNATSAFQIDEDSLPDGSPFIGQTTLGVVGSDDWFQVPHNTPNIKATLTISNFASSGDYIVRQNITTTAVTFEGQGVAANSAYEITGSVTAPAAAGTAIGADGKFEITFSTKDLSPITTPGELPAKYWVSFNIPVVGYATSGTGLEDQTTWFVRGGTATTLGLDLANDDNKYVALLVGPDPKVEVDAEFGW